MSVADVSVADVSVADVSVADVSGESVVGESGLMIGSSVAMACEMFWLCTITSLAARRTRTLSVSDSSDAKGFSDAFTAS